MSAEGGKVDDGSDLFYVSAPPRSRLRIIANSAAQMHLAALVKKARSAAVGAEGVAGAAMMLSAATAGQDTKGSMDRSGGGGGGGVTRETGDEEHGGSDGGSSVGSAGVDRDDDRDARFARFESEIAW